jgi:YggT family protein
MDGHRCRHRRGTSDKPAKRLEQALVQNHRERLMNLATELVGFLIYVLQLLIYVIVIQAILSWLVAFNVINTQNRFVYGLVSGLERFLDPLLRPIRSRLPDLGGIDLSPLVLILGIMLVQSLLRGLALDLLV